ncbi:MAG: hypothetical protein ACI8Y4_005456 [Candidatus Poriferisodalaceae bacterium]|jgi:hypothetical protein
MSDVSQGDGWWQASDGKWYPPQEQPAVAPPPPPTPTAMAAPPEADKKKPLWRRRWFLVILALVVIVVIAGIASSSSEDESDDAGSNNSDSQETSQDDATSAPDTDDDAAPSEETTTVAPTSEADDVIGCRIVDDNNVELEVMNNSSKTSSYFITTVYRDDAGTRLGDEVHIVSNLRSGERTIESAFGFSVEGAACEAADVDRFSAESDDDELDDAVSCTITGTDVLGDLTAEVVVANDSSQTSNYLLEVAFVRADGVRVGTGSALINAVAQGETAPGDVFTTVKTEAATCALVSVQRIAG